MLCLQLRMGRMRRVHAAAMVAAGCAAGWMWLGNSGAALLGLWAWSAWPRWTSQRINVDRSRVRFAQLGASRVFWVERREKAQQVFADEVSPAQFAALRRELKSAARTKAPAARAKKRCGESQKRSGENEMKRFS